jgi:trehalose-phosphatase
MSTPAAGLSDEILAPLLEDPARAAILTDVDGTLAPIVERPENAAVPASVQAVLAELSGRFAIVGCISGRRATEARELVGVEGIAYAGNHGLELLLPGDSTPRLDPSLEGRETAAADYLAGLDGRALESSGLRVEDKGAIQALHWRGAADEAAAEGRAREIAADAGRLGLETRPGRKVLELRSGEHHHQGVHRVGDLPHSGGYHQRAAALFAIHLDQRHHSRRQIDASRDPYHRCGAVPGP